MESTISKTVKPYLDWAFCESKRIGDVLLLTWLFQAK